MFHRGFSSNWIVLLAISLVVLLSPAPTAAQDFDMIGGDDVLITTDDDLSYPPSIDIAENGDIYVAVAATPASGPEIRVYRSQDDGDSWPLWGTITLTGAPAIAMDYPCVHIGEGTQNRIYVALRYRGPSNTNYQIWVCWSDLAPASASWTWRPVMTQTGVDFQSPSIHSDEMSNADYRLYVSAMGSGADGGDVWFSRSTNFGGGFETAYEIFSSTGGDSYVFPEIRYGRGGVVHCVCYFRPIASTGLDYAVRYRRAHLYASGPLSWQPVVDLTSDTDGYDEFHVSVAAGHNSDRVLVGYALRTVGGVWQPGRYRWSTDGGATWPTGNSTFTVDNHLPHLLANDTRGAFYAWGTMSGSDNSGVNSLGYGSAQWSAFNSNLDRPYVGVPSTRTGGQYFDFNATKQGRAGYVWMTWNITGTDSLFFDADWRKDPGYPNLEQGFPVMVNGNTGCVAPPALCELDGDPESEIVFGTADGNIHVYNHDGTPVPGWPVDIGTLSGHHVTVAVGSITGNNENEVVAGNGTGQIYAFRADGTPLPGWPVDMGTGLQAYVALGAISGSQRQVVATSLGNVFLLDGNGSQAPNFPLLLAENTQGGPAIGDVDGDGDREIVVNQVYRTSVYTGGGLLQMSRFYPGKTLMMAPALADLNSDGDLEIAATTSQGDVYVLNPDGTDFPGWPWHDPAGENLTSPILAEVSGGGEAEVVVGGYGPGTPKIHAFHSSGMVVSGFPRSQTPGWAEYATPIADVLHAGVLADVCRGAHDGMSYAWSGAGVDLPGWPRQLPVYFNNPLTCLASAASGDVDGDGNVEVVFVTSYDCMLAIYDLGTSVFRDPVYPTNWWPMFGYNPLRQSCLACDMDAVSGVTEGTPPLEAIRFAPPAPNPSAAPVTLNFELAEQAAARLDIFDVSGRLVRRLVKAELTAGPHEAVWDGRSDNGETVAAGDYFLRLTVDSGAATPLRRKIVVIR